MVAAEANHSAMASFKADVAFPAEIVGTKPSVHWMLEPNAQGGLTTVMFKNRIGNGEIMPENPAGLPKRHKFHKGAVPDEDWFMRFNDRTKTACNASYEFYPESPFAQKGFHLNAMPKHHSRRVFRKLARQGHSFSEGNIVALKEDVELQKDMRRRYNKMMKSGMRKPPEPPKPVSEHPAPPPPEGSQPGSRCGSQSALIPPSLRSSCKPLDEKALSSGSGVAKDAPVNGKDGPAYDIALPVVKDEKPASRLSACWPAAAGSSLSAQDAGRASGSVVSALPPSQLAASRLSSSTSAMQPVASGLAASQISIGPGSGVRGSQPSGCSSLSVPRDPMDSESTVSNFYSWRPRLIR